MTYFRENKFNILEGQFFKFFDTRTKKIEKPKKTKE
jgi:hypothetical protein